ncbi:MAG: slipin family protein, partial [Cytophagaceae bacterium]
GALASEELSERRAELTDLGSEELTAQAASQGLALELVQLRDLTFPKNIQDLFARHLEAKIRAKADLENARTAVATARTLKNAAELLKGDDNIRFFQFLETITKIAEKGKHTFLVGEFPQLPK